MELVMAFNDWLNDIVWGPYMLVLLVGTGIYLSLRSNFIQVSHFGYMWKNTIGNFTQRFDGAEGDITPFQAMSTALAATIGTGNIAGVATAIATGGPGAVFWMWLSAFFGMMTKFGEVVLAVRYRERKTDGSWAGGPMYYIANGLGDKWKWLAALFAIFGTFASFGIGNLDPGQLRGRCLGNKLCHSPPHIWHCPHANNGTCGCGWNQADCPSGGKTGALHGHILRCRWSYYNF